MSFKAELQEITKISRNEIKHHAIRMFQKELKNEMLKYAENGMSSGFLNISEKYTYNMLSTILIYEEKIKDVSDIYRWMIEQLEYFDGIQIEIELSKIHFSWN